MSQDLPPTLAPLLNLILINLFFCRFKYFVFSAFYDARKGQRFIRIIGATKTRVPERVWCRLWFKSDSNVTSYISRTVTAKIKVRK